MKKTIFLLTFICFFFGINKGYAEVYKCINTKTFEIKYPTNQGNCYYGKSRQNINKILDWKNSIYNQYNLNSMQKSILSSINNMECGRDDGFCINKYDAGPFQINRIHRDAYNYTVYLIETKQRDKLFEYQLNWTLERFKRIEKRLCYKYNIPRDKAYCQMKHHNGNIKLINGTELRVLYANKGLKILDEYDKYFYNGKIIYKEGIATTEITNETTFKKYYSIFESNDFLIKNKPQKIVYIQTENKIIKNTKGNSIFKGVFGLQ